MFAEELKYQDVARTTEVSFMIRQLQLEVQQEIQGNQQVFTAIQVDLSEKMDHCISELDQLAISVKNLQTLVLQKNTEPVYSPPVSLLPTSVPNTVKTDHLKLAFPTYGRPQDDPDPVLYLAKCRDFLAVQPLSDVDILATFRTVLHGTARDWWEIARVQVGTWAEFQRDFLSAFLSEDYEEELADRVRSRRQGDSEPIRDFAFSYRALCKRWNPNMAELDIVKMILKNTKPQLTSQLRGRVNTVDELVRLGHQLEKDLEQQAQYRKGKLHVAPDALSRSPVGFTGSASACVMVATQKEPDDFPVTLSTFWEAQQKDMEIQSIVKNLQQGHDDPMSKYEIIQDLLYKKTHLSGNKYHFRLYVPRSLISTMLEASEKAKKRQLRNYNKNKRDVAYQPKDRVWVRNYPQSSAARHFSAKLAPKWKGPYRVLQQMGPVDFQVVREDTGEGKCTVHVNNIKPCFPTAAELDAQEKQAVYDILLGESDDEDFPGFVD
ncbi:uncharacterized protein LOC143118491 [Alosa pseudoharengus]|uniref:uncharacterized protein LOC143118491 n=1 Tax=Alosa pseudoharengus TaxID=34774 RepID=UPI003F8B5878